jgi:hypothetical protein
MSAFEIPTAVTMLWGWLVSSRTRLSSQTLTQHEVDYSNNPKQLESALKLICTEMFTQLKYTGSPKFKDLSHLEALLDMMYKQAVEIGQPLSTPRSSKGFRLGYGLALVSRTWTKCTWILRSTETMINDGI